MDGRWYYFRDVVGGICEPTEAFGAPGYSTLRMFRREVSLLTLDLTPEDALEPEIAR